MKKFASVLCLAVVASSLFTGPSAFAQAKPEKPAPKPTTTTTTTVKAKSTHKKKATHKKGKKGVKKTAPAMGKMDTPKGKTEPAKGKMETKKK